MNAEHESMNALKLGKLFHEEQRDQRDEDWMLRCERQLLRDVRSSDALSSAAHLKSQWSPYYRRGLLAAALVSTLAVGVFYLGTASSPDRTTASVISFTTGDQIALIGGSVVAEEEPKLVHFSDGSALSLRPGTRTRVGEATERGATIILEQGSVESSIIHDEDTQWKVLLGSYEIRVIGTRFTSTWEPGTGEVSVRLHEGAVEILGKGITGGVQLKAGQRFDASNDGVWKVSAATTAPAPEVNADEPALAVEAIEPEETPSEAGEVVETRAKNTGSSAREATGSWSDLIAQGKFQEVLDAAQDRGLDGCLRACSTRNLRALSDAARYKGNTDLARRALLRLRESAPSERARAGYLLGALAEVQGQSASALTWYTRYVSEAPGGLLLSEARAGRLRCLLQLGRKTEARKAAIQYLDMYPQGVGEKVARQILKKP